MDFFICDRCGRKPTTKSNLKKHCFLKQSCKPLLSNMTQQEVRDKYFSTTDKFKCDATECDKYFSTNKIRQVHHKRCKYMALELERGNAPSECPYVINNTTTNTDNSTTNNTTNNTTNITNNNHITINPFGDEDSSHLSENLKFMRQCMGLRKYGFMEYIERKYFDLTHPENMTINKETKKDALVRCSTGDGYKTRLLSEVTDAIVDGYNADISEYLHMDADRNRHKDQSKIKPSTLVRHFMVDIGGPLEMDLSPFDTNSGYDENKWPQKQRDKKKKDLQLLMHDHLYAKSTQLYRPAVKTAIHHGDAIGVQVIDRTDVKSLIPDDNYEPNDDKEEEQPSANGNIKNTISIRGAV